MRKQIPWQGLVEKLQENFPDLDVVWSRNHEVPVLQKENREIILPINEGDNIYFFENPELFLYEKISSTGKSKIFFAGNDNGKKFVTEVWAISSDQMKLAIEKFKTDGVEKPFFDALIPNDLKTMQKIFQTNYLRQGNVYALPVECDATELARIMMALRISSSTKHDSREGNLIYPEDPKHMVQGTLLSVGSKSDIVCSDWVRHTRNEYYFASGRLIVNNRQPLELPGTCMLFTSQVTTINRY